MNSLTTRQNEIAKYISLGFSELEISHHLNIAFTTVHNHATNIRRKIGARCAVDVARKWLLSQPNPKQFLEETALILISITLLN